jgi:hypothetical protein
MLLPVLLTWSTTLGAWGHAAANPGRLDIVAVVGCVAADGPNWTITNATAPIPELLTPAVDAAAAAASVQKAKALAPGKDRYRMLGLVDFFEVPKHKGERVIVKGISIGNARERRLNLLSISSIAPRC